MYTTRMLLSGSPRMWQPFTLIQQSWTYALLSRKSAVSTSQPVRVAYGTHLSFSPNTIIEAVRLGQTSVDEHATSVY
jgi:hypothetical protein